MKIQTLDDVLLHEVQDLYSAEKQIIEALPKMAEACTSDTLREGFEEHLEQTKEQVTRLEKVADLLGASVGREKCKGMEGLLAEGAKLLDNEPSSALDAALISAAQRVEHYEIAGYGSAITFAQLLGEDEVVDLLKETIAEEEETDEKLTEIAESEVNESAETADEEAE